LSSSSKPCTRWSLVSLPAWNAMIATLPPPGPIALASWSAASLAPLMLLVAINGTFDGCGVVPESIETTLIPA